MQRVQQREQEEVAGLPGVLGVEILATGRRGQDVATAAAAGWHPLT